MAGRQTEAMERAIQLLESGARIEGKKVTREKAAELAGVSLSGLYDALRRHKQKRTSDVGARTEGIDG